MPMPRHRVRGELLVRGKGGRARIMEHRWDETGLALTRLLGLRRAVPKADGNDSGARVHHHAAGSAGRNAQPAEPVLPAGAVVADVGGRQAGVGEYDHRVVAVRGQHDLDGRSAGRQRVVAGDAPAEHDAVRRLAGDVGTAGDEAGVSGSCHEGRPDAFGPVGEVLAAQSLPRDDDPWVIGVAAALDRESRWGSAGNWRRPILEVFRGAGQMLHVTVAANRASIRRHGLDWRRMGAAPGVAGSRPPCAACGVRLRRIGGHQLLPEHSQDAL